MAHRPHPPHVRDNLLARVAAGELIRDICAAPGQPSVGAVSFWARRDPAFAAALAAAKAAGRDVRLQPRLAFHEPTARKLLARLAAGETIAPILRDPAMPSRRAYAHWRATQGWFAEEVGRLNAVKEAEKTHRCRRRFRRFDPRLADRIVDRLLEGGALRAILAADPELPAPHVVARWRIDQPDFDANLRSCAIAVAAARRPFRSRCTPALMDAIWERVLFGDTLATIGLQPDMPCRTSLYAWMKSKPAFRDSVAEALDFRLDLLGDQIRQAGARRVAGDLDAKRDWENLCGQADRIEARLEHWGYYGEDECG